MLSVALFQLREETGASEFGTILALATTVSFFLKATVRISLHREGKLGYFASPWCAIDLAFFAACSAIEVADFAFACQLPLVPTLRLIASLCIVNALFANDLGHSDLDAEIRRLQLECDRLERINQRLRRELDEIERRMETVEREYQALAQQTNPLGSPFGFLLAAVFEF